MIRTAVHHVVNDVLTEHGLGSGTPLARALTDAVADALADALRDLAPGLVSDLVHGPSASTRVEDLDLPVTPYNCLKREGLHTVGDVLACRAVPDPDGGSLHDLRGFSPHVISKIVDALADAGIPHHDDAQARAQDWFVHRPTSAERANQWRSLAHVLTTHPDTNDAFRGLGAVLADHADAVDADLHRPGG